VRRARAGAVLLTLGLLSAACGSGGTEEVATDDARPSAEVAQPLSFTAITLSGEEKDVASLTGEPVVLWFWAPWCTICRVEAPDVAAVAADLEGEVTILGVPGLGPTDDMRAFVADTGTDGLEHLVDADGSLWQRFGVVSQPSFAFVSPDGAVELFGGALGAEQLEARAAALITG
jgi:thiol-disulfide isomerase/thioredoxin